MAASALGGLSGLSKGSATRETRKWPVGAMLLFALILSLMLWAVVAASLAVL